jgi:DNA-binding MarR family transcriptional regulator
MVAVVDELERLGLVERRRDPAESARLLAARDRQGTARAPEGD